MMFGRLKDRIRAQNQRRRARRRANRAPVQTPQGFHFIGPRYMQDGVYEAELVTFIAHLIAMSDRFVNVGANAGYYCAIAQTKGVPTLAFEPNPDNFALLARNMQLNGWGEQITALPLAAGETSGFLTLYGEGTGSSLVPGWANNPQSGGHRARCHA
ncbi:MAG: FkbM family methyltransferase [Pseudomonadota bacterium]